MSRRMLAIERVDRDRFMLAISGGTLTIGASAADADVVLRHLHITRLHCEVEIDEDLVVADSAGVPPRELRPGGTLHAGLTHLRFQAGDVPAPTADVPELALGRRAAHNRNGSHHTHRDPAVPLPGRGRRR